MNFPVVTNGLTQFLNQVRTIKPLSPEREHELAVKFLETGDTASAHELVVSHLPFVVKIAFQYRYYMIPIPDLVQEGSIGLMKAVKRFDPHKGYRLVSFAVWWIKAYIKNYILKSWNLVKLGTTQAQRKLFFRIGDIGEHADEQKRNVRIKELAEELNVKEDDVIEMEARVRAREWSLNETLGEGGDMTSMDLLEDDSGNQEARLIQHESDYALSEATESALSKLDARERFIIEKRVMEDEVWTLQELGDHFGTSRERVRQLEKRALTKLKAHFDPELVEMLAAA